MLRDVVTDTPHDPWMTAAATACQGRRGGGGGGPGDRRVRVQVWELVAIPLLCGVAMTPCQLCVCRPENETIIQDADEDGSVLGGWNKGMMGKLGNGRRPTPPRRPARLRARPLRHAPHTLWGPFVESFSSVVSVCDLADGANDRVVPSGASFMRRRRRRLPALLSDTS